MTASCATCERLRDGLRCAAYPEQIPWPVLMGGVDHLDPLPGDHGLRYVPRADLGKAVKYSPDQPREPAGTSAGGEFAGGAGGFASLHAEVTAAQVGAANPQQAAHAWLAARVPNLWDGDDALDLFRPEDAATVAAQLASLVAQYPATAERLTAARIHPEATYLSLFMSPETGRNSMAVTSGGQIAFNGKLLGKDAPQVDAYYAGKRDSGWFPAGTAGMRAIAAHEFGHVLEDVVTAGRPGEGSAAGRARLEAFLARAPAVDTLSTYATHSHGEAFAEAVSQMTVAPRAQWAPFTVALHDWLGSERTKAFNPDQPRDDHGRWTSDGSSAEPARQPDLPPTRGGLGSRDASTRPDPEFDRLKREVLAVTDIKRVQNADGARVAAVRWLAAQRTAAGVADKDQRVGLWGLPWVMVQDVVPTLARFYQDYPRAADYLRSVDILPSSQFQGGGPTVAAHAWDDGTFSRLEGNGYRMRQVDDYALSRGGWFPEGTNKVRGVLTHELGHVVNHHLDRQLNGRPPGDRARDDWKDLQKQPMSSPALSAYSMASQEPRRRWREGFAEAFAQYRLAPVEKWTHPTHQLAAFLERPWVAAVLGSAPHKAVHWFFVARAYNPDEPRLPAGGPGGGEWTSDGAAGGPISVDPLLASRPPGPMLMNRIDQYAGEYLDAVAKAAGLSPEEYQQQLEDHLASLLADSEVRVQAPSERLDKILKDDRFKTSFEVRGSYKRVSGYLGVRENAEEDAFSLPPGTPPEDRPIYGYASNPGHQPAGWLDQYGSASIELKPGVRDRSTFVLGDSVDSHMPPSPMGEPRWHSALYPMVLRAEAIKRGDQVIPPDPLKAANAATAAPAGYYTEVQVHGGLRPADISRVVFGEPPPAKTVKALDKAGIAHLEYRMHVEAYPGRGAVPPLELAHLENQQVARQRRITNLTERLATPLDLPGIRGGLTPEDRTAYTAELARARVDSSAAEHNLERYRRGAR
jgi:hypothetical protein